jgi:hypothetical protein
MAVLFSCQNIPCEECNLPNVTQDTFYLGDTSNLIFKKDLKVIWNNGESQVIFNPIYISTYQDTYSVKYQFGLLKYNGERIELQLDSTLELK